MPAQFTIPPDTRTVGASGLVSDHNNMVDWLSAQPGAITNVLNSSYSGGADPTGVADSTAAFQAAINAVSSKGGIVLVPPGTYRLDTGGLNIVPGLYLIGPGGYTSTILNCTGSSGNLFNLDPPGYGTSTPIENVVISGFTINATGMDIFYGSNIVRSKIVGNFLNQKSPGNAIMNVTPTSGLGTTYMAECEFANKEMGGSATRTYEMWHLDFSSTASGSKRGNDNVWHGWGNKIWTQPGAYWMTIIGDASGNTGSRGNKWRDLIFEASGGCGGLINMQNTADAVLDFITVEDLSSNTISNPLIQLGTNGTPGGCSLITISNYKRRSGNNISNSIPDIKMDANSSIITVASPGQDSGGTVLTVDFGSGTHIAKVGAWPSGATLLNASGVSAGYSGP